MATLISVLIIIICFILALVILVQNPKGGGLDSTFGSASQLGGVQKTTDFLEKATWTMAIAIVVLSLVSASIQPSATEATQQDEFRDEAPAQPLQPDNGGALLPESESPATTPTDS